DHGDDALDVVDGTGALALVPGGEIALAQRQRDRAPAAYAMLLQECARFLDVVLGRLAGYLDALVAVFLDPGERLGQRLGAHPIMRRKMHGIPPENLPRRARRGQPRRSVQNWFDQLCRKRYLTHFP